MTKQERMIATVTHFIRENPGGLGSLLVKNHLEAVMGVRLDLVLFDTWLRDLAKRGVIIFHDYGAGGVCFHPADPSCRGAAP